MRIKKAFALFIIIYGILLIMYIFFIKQISPTIRTLSDNRAKAIALKATNEAVMEKISEIKYDNLMHVSVGENGKITGLNADVIEMNKLSVEITNQIQEKLLSLEGTKFGIPIGKALGLSVFSGYGPHIIVKAIPMGNVVVDFKTEFKTEGINQTRHRIYIQVKTSVRMVAPFITEIANCESNITVAETVIVGDIPESYYNLQGIDDINLKDTIEYID
ncbi:MAG: sporulation protein YunB [Clostridia bacterium]|nr:sporulation protein YunB [Clostridia bacterium]